MNYKDKYIKYYTKYLKLKNIKAINQKGGGNTSELRSFVFRTDNFDSLFSSPLSTRNLIIHISGPQGAGKTTLGNKIKKKYNNLKLKAVKYYKKINNFVSVCKIFECSERSLKKCVEKY